MQGSNFSARAIPPLIVYCLFVVSGCVATRDWVQTYVPEQLFPLSKRVSETEAGMTQMGGRVSTVESRVDKMGQQIAELDSRLNQTNAKADRAIENLQRLKLDRKLLLDLKQGAFFRSNSTVLTDQAEREIDSFLSDLKGDPDGTGSLLFVVEGHSDNVGSERANYHLARVRAENVASHLAKQKKIDPSRLVVMSYGESAPVADNATEAGRAKNRRVEIHVYKESIGVVAPDSKALSPSKQRVIDQGMSTSG
jgi:outer membrane protein OmpA-like peptidoglycan-associated protein